MIVAKTSCSLEKLWYLTSSLVSAVKTRQSSLRTLSQPSLKRKASSTDSKSEQFRLLSTKVFTVSVVDPNVCSKSNADGKTSSIIYHRPSKLLRPNQKSSLQSLPRSISANISSARSTSVIDDETNWFFLSPIDIGAKSCFLSIGFALRQGKHSSSIFKSVSQASFG